MIRILVCLMVSYMVFNCSEDFVSSKLSASDAFKVYIANDSSYSKWEAIDGASYYLLEFKNDSLFDLSFGFNYPDGYSLRPYMFPAVIMIRVYDENNSLYAKPFSECSGKWSVSNGDSFDIKMLIKTVRILNYTVLDSVDQEELKQDSLEYYSVTKEYFFGGAITTFSDSSFTLETPDANFYFKN